jgi:uncharacterized membrane protein YfcA
VSLTVWSVLALCVAGLAGGFANTIASSGSAVTLPALLAFGVAAPVANGTNRVAVFVGALAALWSFWRAKVVDWRHLLPLGLAAAAGTGIGVAIAVTLPAPDIHVAILGAVFAALGLLCLRPKRWLRTKELDELRFGWQQLLLIGAVGVWAGFIVLDSATYFLFTLVLAVGYSVVHANAMKIAIMVVTAPIALGLFLSRGDILWWPAIALSVGAVAGSLGAAKLSMHRAAATWMFRVLVVVVAGEAAQLVIVRFFD